MKEVQISGKTQLKLIVDDEDYERVSSQKWHVRQNKETGYLNGTANRHGVYIHVFINGRPPAGLEWDHKDGDRLNNQKSNLRLATSSQNKANRGPRKDNKCGFKGVRWKVDHGWEARVHKDGKTYFLGYYYTKEKAAKVYDDMAVKLFGEFAYTNF